VLTDAGFTGITVAPAHGDPWAACSWPPSRRPRRTQMLPDEFSGAASAAVDAPAGDVFALITDIERLPERNARIRRVSEPPRPVARARRRVGRADAGSGRQVGRALFARLRGHHLRDKVPASLRALAALLAKQSVTAST
jgi:hypothetical protein